ncbi:cytochrome P450 1D1 [Sinocyclocheilus rhinocerous]|uniref:cytochrome P450 1D1 n=1 Tax=Sinocyclocheilus rhinocerous TaxID=307959 RepID=UPI0007B7BFAE|nr:PREDICTED: cytochrome P450 1A1-like [Sinocyclocheilus rhinocerous]
MYLEEISHTTGVTLFLCAFAMLLLVLHGRRREPGCSLPPGPTPWPLVGNLFQMGEQIHLSLTNLRVQYGDVFQMKMGSLVVVVLSGYSTIKEALVRQGEAFAGRPDFFTFSAVANGTSMTFSEKYGEAWVLHKKICRNALKTFSQAESRDSSASCLLEERICAEAVDMMEALKKQADEFGDSGLDPVKLLVTSVANVVCTLCFGKRYAHDDKEFLTIVNINNEVLRLFAAGNLADFFPIFRYLPSPSLRKLLQYIDRMNNFMERNISEHLITFDRSSSAKTVYEVQKNQVGMNRLPQFKDKPNMPYTEAFIYEVFRHASYMPFTIPHCTTDNITLNGYFIPKDTCVFINQYQVNHDMNIWGDAEAFRPERFLTLSGHLNKNLTERVMIFGIGIRRCLGDSFARLEMFVFLTTLLHRLHIENVPGQELDLSSTFALTMKPRPFRIKISTRN